MSDDQTPAWLPVVPTEKELAKESLRPHGPRALYRYECPTPGVEPLDVWDIRPFEWLVAGVPLVIEAMGNEYALMFRTEPNVAPLIEALPLDEPQGGVPPFYIFAAYDNPSRLDYALLEPSERMRHEIADMLRTDKDKGTTA